jgi:hypothetical protein
MERSCKVSELLHLPSTLHCPLSGPAFLLGAHPWSANMWRNRALCRDLCTGHSGAVLCAAGPAAVASGHRWVWPPLDILESAVMVVWASSLPLGVLPKHDDELMRGAEPLP